MYDFFLNFFLDQIHYLFNTGILASNHLLFMSYFLKMHLIDSFYWLLRRANYLQEIAVLVNMEINVRLLGLQLHFFKHLLGDVAHFVGLNFELVVIFYFSLQNLTNSAFVVDFILYFESSFALVRPRRQGNVYANIVNIYHVLDGISVANLILKWILHRMQAISRETLWVNIALMKLVLFQMVLKLRNWVISIGLKYWDLLQLICIFLPLLIILRHVQHLNFFTLNYHNFLAVHILPILIIMAEVNITMRLSEINFTAHQVIFHILEAKGSSKVLICFEQRQLVKDVLVIALLTHFVLKNLLFLEF